MEILEYLLVAIIICGQIWYFIQTYKKINYFTGIFPEVGFFGVFRVWVPSAEMTQNPKTILSQINKYIVRGATESDPDTAPPDSVNINLIHSGKHYSEVLDRIKISLNTYLIRNRKSSPEFDLVKDIVDRNCDAVEEEINATISVPLYLGLLGTLVGIIFGLFNISGLTMSTGSLKDQADVLTQAIPVLLGGVRIAMIASFTGLLLTILNSSIFFKQSKSLLERRKNDFLTFLQIELFPLLTDGVGGTMNTLQANLQRFTDSFSGDIAKLSGLMNQNRDVLIAQEKIITALESIDITEFAKANIKVLKELQASTAAFASFNDYVSKINETLAGTKTLTGGIAELLEKTSSMHTLAVNINTSFAENKQLMSFLQSHYSALDQSKQMLVDSVSGVNKVLKNALDELETFTKTSITEIQHVILREIKLMDNEYPEKWKKLDNLSSLEDIKKEVYQIKLVSAGQIGSLHTDLKSLMEHIKSLEQIVLEISKKETLADKISNSIKSGLGRGRTQR